ncbi:MAG: hypothetical protein ACI3ZZ_03550 [Candidatus Aphodosoma sp.]
MAESRCEIKVIGGYFELANREQADNFPHKDGILLNTGRNALEYILRSIKDIKYIYLPYFTCEVVLEPIKKLGIPYQFYQITPRFEIADRIVLGEGEYIIVNNYYGIKDFYIRSLYARYGEHLIVDCAQAFFSLIDTGIKAFYSTRKFVGVADGGIAYLGNEIGADVSQLEEEQTESHFDHLLIRKENGAEEGFRNFQVNEEALDNQPIRQMSVATKDTLLHIDYEKIKQQRIRNWNILNDALAAINQIQTPLTSDFECPMVYPFEVENGMELRQKLISEKVFVAKYWPNVIPYVGFEFEVNLADKVVCLPLDQRYETEDMNRIIEIIKK